MDKAGVDGIDLDFQKLGWDKLFENAERLDIFFAYGSTWRGTHLNELRQFLAKKKTKLRVIFPDPDCPECVSELTRRFVGYDLEKTTRLIREGIKGFAELGEECSRAGAVEIKVTKSTPVLTLYNFGSKIVFTPYRHRPGKGEIPTFIVRRGGTLYAFFEAEFDCLWGTAVAVKSAAPSVSGGQ